MAFIKANWQKITSSINDREPRGWSYSSITDDQADIQTAGYFDDIFSEVNTGDFLYIKATDDARFYEITKSGSSVVISDVILLKNVHSYEYTTNTAGTVEEFYLDIYPEFHANLGTVQVSTAVTGDSTFDFVLKSFDTDGFPQTLGSLNFTSATAYPSRKSFIISPDFVIGEFTLTWWEKTNGGTAQSIRYLGAIRGISIS